MDLLKMPSLGKLKLSWFGDTGLRISDSSGPDVLFLRKARGIVYISLENMGWRGRPGF